MKQRGSNGRAKDARDRREGGSASANLIFGVLPVLEALRADGRSVEKIFIAEGKPHQRMREIASLARERNVPVNTVPRAAIERQLERGANHQGVLAYCASAGYADAGDLLSRLAGSDTSVCLVLDGIEDPHNLGAIVRTAECAGVAAVFLPERRSSGLNETVAKTSAGAVEMIDIARVTNVNRLLEDLKDAGFWIAGADGGGESDYTEIDWKGKWALVLGSEGSGIHKLTREKCDVLVKIPLYGRIGSLNVSVAAGVLLFEMARQRGTDQHRVQENG